MVYHLARRPWRIPLALSFALLFIAAFTIVTATPASAHYVYERGHTYASSTDCAWARSEVSHGNGGGYAQADVAADYRQWTPVGPIDCGNKLWTRPPGYLAVRAELYKWNASQSQWQICRDSGGYAYNPESAHSIYIYNYFGGYPPCGSGYYGTIAYSFEYNGDWHGGPMWSGFHWLPA